MQAARGTSLNDSEATPPPAPRRRRPLGLFAVTAVAVLATDLVTKVLAIRELEGQPSVQIVGDLLRFNLVRNPGAAFSTGTSLTWLLSLLALGAVAVVLVVSRSLGSRLWAFGLGALLGGVLGNLTDRIFRSPGPLHGEVVDFIQLPHWPVFNVADMAINVAAAVIIVQTFRGISHRGADQDAARDATPDATPDATRGATQDGTP